MQKNENTSKIFVCNYAGHNISAAFEHGENATQVNITEGNVNIFDTQRITYLIQEKLKDSCPGDFLLLSGSILLNCIAFNLWMNLHGAVKLLIWNPKTRKYVCLKIDGYRLKIDG